jgi:hypothetical protein
MSTLLLLVICLAQSGICGAVDLYGIKFNRVLDKKTTVDPRISQNDKIFAKNGPKFIFFKINIIKVNDF